MASHHLKVQDQSQNCGGSQSSTTPGTPTIPTGKLAKPDAPPTTGEPPKKKAKITDPGKTADGQKDGENPQKDDKKGGRKGGSSPNKEKDDAEKKNTKLWTEVQKMKQRHASATKCAETLMSSIEHEESWAWAKTPSSRAKFDKAYEDVTNATVEFDNTILTHDIPDLRKNAWGCASQGVPGIRGEI